MFLPAYVILKSISPYLSPLTYILFVSLLHLLSKSTSHIQDTSFPSAILLFNKRKSDEQSEASLTSDNDLSSPAGFFTRRIQSFFPSISIFSIRPKAACTLATFEHTSPKRLTSPLLTLLIVFNNTLTAATAQSVLYKL